MRKLGLDPTNGLVATYVPITPDGNGLDLFLPYSCNALIIVRNICAWDATIPSETSVIFPFVMPKQVLQEQDASADSGVRLP